MSIQVVLNQHDLVSVGIDLLAEEAHHVRLIHSRAPLTHDDVTLARQRLKQHEQGAGAMPLVLVVHTLDLPWLGCQWCAHLAQELLGGLVQAHLGTQRINGAGVDLEHLFHLAHEGRVVQRWDAPHLLEPGLQLVF